MKTTEENNEKKIGKRIKTTQYKENWTKKEKQQKKTSQKITQKKSKDDKK